MKAQYKAKAMLKEFLKSESNFMFYLYLNRVIKKVRFLRLFSLLTLVKYMWSKFLSMQHS